MKVSTPRKLSRRLQRGDLSALARQREASRGASRVHRLL